MPPVAAVNDAPGELGGAVAHLPSPMHAWPLPRHIITERGESLQAFVARRAPDFISSMTVRPPRLGLSRSTVIPLYAGRLYSSLRLSRSNF